jgi:hypothetical protein
VLGVLANVHSLSEPDIFGSIACHIALKTPGFDNELAKKLIRASTVLWTTSIKTSKPETDIIAFKHRGFVTIHADAFALAVPEAKVCPAAHCTQLH